MSTKRKNLVYSVILFVIILLSFSFVYASTGFSGSLFAGKITDTKAREIQEEEESGFTCDFEGTSITISNPIKGDETYVIPSNVTSKTGREIMNNKWIIGRYEPGEEVVTCTKDEGEVKEVDVLILNRITFFGNS